MNPIETIIDNRLKQYGLTKSQINKPRYRRQKQDIIMAVIDFSRTFSPDYKQKYIRRLLRYYGLEFSDKEFRTVHRTRILETGKALDAYKAARIRWDHKPDEDTLPVLAFANPAGAFLIVFKLYLLNTKSMKKHKKLPKDKRVVKLGSENFYTSIDEFGIWVDELDTIGQMSLGFAEYISSGYSNKIDIVSSSDFKGIKFNVNEVIAISIYRILRA